MKREILYVIREEYYLIIVDVDKYTEINDITDFLDSREINGRESLSKAMDEYCENCDSLANMFISDVIKVIKSIEKEYNNGWIPCSERLPEEHKLYDITFKNSAGIHSDSAIYNPYLKRWLWDADETELVENEVLAWAEKREPYRRKRCEEYVIDDYHAREN